MTVHFLGLVKFVREVSEKGKVQHFIVHARKAVLNAKFSPDMNRRIPPLKYDYVYDLIKDFPHLQVSRHYIVQCSVVWRGVVQCSVVCGAMV